MQIGGFSAISAANGWEFALLGFLIVFLGLGLLALTISGMHRCLDGFEQKGRQFRERRKEAALEVVTAKKTVQDLARKKGIRKSYVDYAMLSEIMPSPLALPALLDAACQRGIPRCHAVMADLLRAGVLKADGRGYYLWDQTLFDALIGDE